MRLRPAHVVPRRYHPAAREKDRRDRCTAVGVRAEWSCAARREADVVAHHERIDVRHMRHVLPTPADIGVADHRPHHAEFALEWRGERLRDAHGSRGGCLSSAARLSGKGWRGAVWRLHALCEGLRPVAALSAAVGIAVLGLSRAALGARWAASRARRQARCFLLLWCQSVPLQYTSFPVVPPSSRTCAEPPRQKREGIKYLVL